MAWQHQLHGDSVTWLVNSEEPNLRYLALRDLLDRPEDDPDLVTAQKAAHARGPLATVLDAMDAEGYWVKAGPGYNPKYRSTVWSIILLAQLGAAAALDQRIARAFGHGGLPAGQSLLDVTGIGLR